MAEVCFPAFPGLLSFFGPFPRLFSCFSPSLLSHSPGGFVNTLFQTGRCAELRSSFFALLPTCFKISFGVIRSPFSPAGQSYSPFFLVLITLSLPRLTCTTCPSHRSEVLLSLCRLFLFSFPAFFPFAGCFGPFASGWKCFESRFLSAQHRSLRQTFGSKPSLGPQAPTPRVSGGNALVYMRTHLKGTPSFQNPIGPRSRHEFFLTLS